MYSDILKGNTSGLVIEVFVRVKIYHNSAHWLEHGMTPKNYSEAKDLLQRPTKRAIPETKRRYYKPIKPRENFYPLIW